jgi:hypothetical protein
MFKKLLFAASVAAISAFGLIACDKGNNVDSPFPVTTQKALTWDDVPEIADDSEPGARVGLAVTPIDKANRVYLVMRVTGICATTNTAASAVNASIAMVREGEIGYTDGNAAMNDNASIPDSLVKGAKGWQTFSVKPALFNTYVKKTIDKSKNYVFFSRDRDAKRWKPLVNQDANQAVFAFLPNYFKLGYSFGCGTSTSVNLSSAP